MVRVPRASVSELAQVRDSRPVRPVRPLHGQVRLFVRCRFMRGTPRIHDDEIIYGVEYAEAINIFICINSADMSAILFIS